MQRIAFQPRREVGFMDALLRFGLGKGLHIRQAGNMSNEHDLIRFRVGLIKDRFQHMHHKIHGSDIVIMDEDAVERLKLGFILLFFDNFDFRANNYFHVYIRMSSCFWMYSRQNQYSSLSVLNSCSVSSMSAASKFSRMCCGLSDIGMVMTRGWATSHASAI